MTDKRKINDIIRGKLSVAFMRTLGLLPLRVNRALGAIVGQLLWWSQGKAVETCLLNIAKCFPEKTLKAQRQLARQSMIETARTALESLSVWRQPYHRFHKYILKIEGAELIDRNFYNHCEKSTDHKGVLMLVPHLGSWEVMGGYLAEKGDAMYMYEPTGTPEIDEFMKNGRSQCGATLVPTNRSGVSMMLKHLKRGGLAVILPDQVPDRNSGVVAPFFGNPALTMTLVQKMAQRTQCDVLMGTARRVPGGFHFIYHSPEVYLGTDYVNESVTAMNHEIEKIVRAAPEQYHGEYRRSRRVPKET